MHAGADMPYISSSCKGERSADLLPGAPRAPAQRHEYGTLDCTIEVVDSMQDAVDHLHA